MTDGNYRWRRSLIILVILIVILSLLFVFPPGGDNSQSTASPTPTPTSTFSPTPMVSPTPTATPSPTDTPTPPSPAEVYFLDLEYYTPEDEPYLAGFKIDSESFDSAFNQVYGQNYSGSFFEHYNVEQGDVYAEVRAECWVGNISQRPTDLTKRVGLGQEIRRGQDTWVIGEIPRRNDINEDEYACLFGFQNSSLGIFSGSNETGIQIKVHEQKVQSRDEVEERPRATVVSEPFKEFPSSEHPVQLYHDSHCSTDPKPETCSEETYFSIRYTSFLTTLPYLKTRTATKAL